MMEGESPRLLPEHIKCPPGTVLIKRTTKDLIMANKLEALGLNYPSTSHLHQAPAKSGHAIATLHYYRHNFGARTIMNVWRPKTLSDQASLASLWISNGPLNNLKLFKLVGELIHCFFGATTPGYMPDGLWIIIKLQAALIISVQDLYKFTVKSLGLVINHIYVYNDRLRLVSSLPACYEAVVSHGAAPNSIDLYYGGPGQCKI
ncbi:Detected protein of unknown function [Hibiscus syriacus]|uniref:Uncharacterized protein n=1 Tax=Hibiscus syriacus TaxID=106335 RepID=A0A6A3CRY9_HIBSY|nr:Detected protein of unknown function [Hibiscus syriacus]